MSECVYVCNLPVNGGSYYQVHLFKTDGMRGMPDISGMRGDVSVRKEKVGSDSWNECCVVAVDIFIWESVVSLFPDHADVLLAV